NSKISRIGWACARRPESVHLRSWLNTGLLIATTESILSAILISGHHHANEIQYSGVQPTTSAEFVAGTGSQQGPEPNKNHLSDHIAILLIRERFRRSIFFNVAFPSMSGSVRRSLMLRYSRSNAMNTHCCRRNSKSRHTDRPVSSTQAISPSRTALSTRRCSAIHAARSAKL